MRCSIRRFDSNRSSCSPSPRVAERSATHISCLFPEILTIIFGYLEVRDKGRAAQVSYIFNDCNTTMLLLQRFVPTVYVQYECNGCW